MSKVKIEQVRSIIGRHKSQKRTMQALGLTKMHKCVEVELTPQIKGMLDKVAHLINITEAR